MNKSFYISAIFVLGLTVAAGLFQSLLHFQLGSQLFYQQAFADWFLVATSTALVGSFFLLKYFHYQRYWFSFSAGTLLTLLTLGQGVLVYIILIWVASELVNFNIFLLVLSLGAGILLALSLIFSKAGKSPSLRTAGVLMFITHLVFLSAIIASRLLPGLLVDGTLEKIQRWLALANNVVPVFFIVHFRRELKLLPTQEVNASRQESMDNRLALIGLIVVAPTLFFGSQLAIESHWSLDWRKRGPQVAQQLAQPFEARTYVTRQGDTLHYLLLRPLAYVPAKKYPLVVCLHGGPGPGQVRAVEVPEPAPFLSNPANREKYPAFLFVPQCPPGFSWGGLAHYPTVDSLVFETIQALEEEFAIDEKRRYVAGGSMGGYGAWHFIGSRPNMFAAAIPVCGAGNPELAQKMVEVAVWAFHGSSDRNVPVSGSRDMIEAIKTAGGHPRYTEFPNVGHNVWPEINQTPEVLDWLFAQQRE